MGRTLAKAHQWVSAGVVQYVYCKTKSMIADVFTKPLPYGQFVYFRDRMLNEPASTNIRFSDVD